jgi:hypothetical protein
LAKNTKHNEVDELWLSIASREFPKECEARLLAMKYEAVISWGMGDESSLLADLYDKFVMMKRLKGIDLT